MSLKIDTTTLTTPNVHKRLVTPHAIVLHDTVSHSAAGTVKFWQTQGKGYGTHFLVDADGTVYQLADPAKHYVVHCGGFNSASIGIDAVAILDPSLANAGELTRIVDRPWSASKRKGKVIDYTGEQYAALVGLVESLCAQFGIPRRIPAFVTGFGAKHEWLRDTYQGVLPHGAWSAKRWDGLLAQEALLGAGLDPVGANS